MTLPLKKLGNPLKANLLSDINSQSGTSYTLAATDAGQIVSCSNASPFTLTVPSNGTVPFDIGTYIIVIQSGAGQVTFAPGIAVVLNSASGNLTTSAQNSIVVLRKTGTNTWYLSGDLTVTSNVLAVATNVGISGTVAKTAALSFSLAGNKLGLNKCVAIYMSGTLTNVSTTHTITLELNYGGTAMWADVSSALTAAASPAHPIYCVFYLANAGTANAQVLGGYVSMAPLTGAASGLGDIGAVNTTAASTFFTAIRGSASIDSTAAQTLALNVTLSATTNTSFTVDYAIAYMLGEGQKGDTGATGATGTAGVGASSITENAQSGTAYTLVLADKGKVVTCTNAGAITLTVPTNASVAFTAGDVIYVCQGGAGAVTIAAAGGVTLKKPYTLITAVQDAWLTLVYMGSDVWRVTGQST